MSVFMAFDLPPAPVAETGYARGQVLADRYELTRILGQGGTAVVWVARDSVLDVNVAAKIVLRSGNELSSEARERAIQEARLTAQLTDPAICRVLDFGFTEHGDPFVVSELLVGETLEGHLTRVGCLLPVQAVRLLLPILDGLAAAHRKGIVHRDVKPGNVFLASSEGRLQPKLLDFGIACSRDGRGRVTAAGTICGTPCYMSPEQACASGDIDQRSDLWSFCVMLYETVSGTVPFMDDDCNVTLFAIANQTAPSLASLGCNVALSRIVERGMAKERSERWPSATELADALARWLVDLGCEADSCGISLRRRFIEERANAVPALLGGVEAASNAPGITAVPRARKSRAGTIALVSSFAAIGVFVGALGWVRWSARSGALRAWPHAAAPATSSPVEPALPVPEGEQPSHAEPLAGGALPDGATDATLTSKRADTPHRHSASERPEPGVNSSEESGKPSEPLSLPPPSPFAPSAPSRVNRGREATPPATRPAKVRGSSRSDGARPPVRDYGI